MLLSQDYAANEKKSNKNILSIPIKNLILSLCLLIAYLFQKKFLHIEQHYVSITLLRGSAGMADRQD